MSKSPNQKLKLLYLMEILLQQTDERHPMTVPEMISELAKHGVAAERKSIYNDLESLRIFGLDIVQTKSRTTGYYIGARSFEVRSSSCWSTACSRRNSSRTKRRWPLSKKSKVLPASMMRSSCSGRSMSTAASRA